MCTMPFVVHTFWSKPPCLNFWHIKAILLFMGVKFSPVKNLELGKLFSLFSMEINFYVVQSREVMFLICKSNNDIFFLMPTVWQAPTSLLLIFTSFALNMFTKLFLSFSLLTTTGVPKTSTLFLPIYWSKLWFGMSNFLALSSSSTTLFSNVAFPSWSFQLLLLLNL